MAIVLSPNGGLFAGAYLRIPTLLGVRPWRAHGPISPIGPGELDATLTASRLIYWQWQEDPSWASLASIIGFGFQVVVTEQLQISAYRTVGSSFGSTLDEIGAPVGFARLEVPEELYRAGVRARGRSMLGDAGIDAVMAPARALLGTGVKYSSAYPRAFCWVITAFVSVEVVAMLKTLLDPVPGAGIAACMLLAPADSPGWDWTTAQTWAASWSSIYGPVDASSVSPWGWAIAVGV